MNYAAPARRLSPDREIMGLFEPHGDLGIKMPRNFACVVVHGSPCLRLHGDERLLLDRSPLNLCEMRTALIIT